MAIKWMGRYRDFVSAVVKHSNQYNRVANVDSVSFEDKTFSSIEWQILEYVYEHPDDTGNMSVISEALGLATSSFSKSTAKLVRLGLVEKYMVDGNRKNIILRVSEEGRRCYDYIVENQMKALFLDAFAQLDCLDNKQLAAVVSAISMLGYLPETPMQKQVTPKKLIRVEYHPRCSRTDGQLAGCNGVRVHPGHQQPGSEQIMAWKE